MDNCISAAGNLLTKLKVRHTKGYLEDSIMAHPDYPSLLCVLDTLEKYAIESLAVKVDSEKLKELPLPCVVQFSDHGGMFHVLTNFSDNVIEFLDDKGNTIVTSKEEFQKKMDWCLSFGKENKSFC